MKAIIIWSLILLVLITVFFTLYERTQRLIFGAILFENKAGIGISIAEFRDADDKNKISFSARVTDNDRLSTQAPVKSAPAEIIYANLASELHMLTGVFPNTYNTVAISDALAVKWFFSTDIIGVEIFVGDKQFSICGVFREVAPILSDENKNETVYLHLSAYPNSEKQITQLLIRPGNMLPAEVIDRASQILDKKLMPEDITNYHMLQRMVQQSRFILWFFPGLCAAVMLFIIFYKQSVAIVRYIRDTSESYEKKLKWSRLLWRGILCIALLGSAAAIIWLVLFEPYFPSDIILLHGGEVNDVILLHAISTLTLLPGIMLVRAVNISLRA